MLHLFRKKSINPFSPEENALIVSAIQSAELNTSGEIRVYVESRCSFVNPMDRAIEIFGQLKMYNTLQRNAVLVYVAIKDRQLAVFGDEGIHQKVGNSFWNAAVKNMLQHFNASNYAQGMANIVIEIGDALKQHFPYDAATDINELPDEIVFGK